MSEIAIPLSKITPREMEEIERNFAGLYDDMYVDGDRNAVVIKNPSTDLERILRRTFF